MNKGLKNLLILLGVMLLLVLLFNKSLYTSNKKKLLSLNLKKIQYVTLKNQHNTLLIKKTNNIWMLENSLPADAEKLDRALASAEAFTKKDLVSRNKKRRSLFQVDNNGIKVILSDSLTKTNFGFIVGKMSSDYMHTYVRKIGDNNIYKEPGRLSYTFSVNPEYWSRKKVFYFGLDKKPSRFSISNISIISNPFVLEGKKKNQKWILQKPEKEGDEKKLASLARDLQYLRLQEFVTQTNIHKVFTNITGRIALSYKKQIQTLEISSFITNGSYLCRLSVLPDLYFTVKTDNIKRVFKNPEELIKPKLKKKETLKPEKK